MQKYYKCRFPNRRIKFNNDQSYLIISVDNCKIKLSFQYYSVLNAISNGKLTMGELIKATKLSDNNIMNIISHLQDENILLPNFNINMKIGNTNNSINLAKKKIIDEEEEVKEELAFDRSNLVDCFLIRILKKHEGITFHKLLINVRKELKQWFLIDDKLFTNCLNKLIDKEYIKFENNNYYYIV